MEMMTRGSRSGRKEALYTTSSYLAPWTVKSLNKCLNLILLLLHVAIPLNVQTVDNLQDCWEEISALAEMKVRVIVRGAPCVCVSVSRKKATAFKVLDTYP